MEVTLQSAKRLSNVVNELLTLYRANRELDTAEIDLESLFRDIWTELGSVYAEKGHQFRYDFVVTILVGDRYLL